MDRQEFSSLVSLALDSMGYSYETVRNRQRQLFSTSYFQTSEDDGVHAIVVGSTAEGVSQLFSPNSDLDIMLVVNDIEIFEDTPDSKSGKEKELELQMEYDNVAPGYTMVKCINIKSSTIHNLRQRPCLEMLDVLERDNSYYLRHSLNEFQETQNKTTTKDEEFCEIAGPALTIDMTLLGCKYYTHGMDLVIAIPCFCSSHIRNWLTRTKYYGWPDKELVSKTKNQIGYVVPVGVKGSKNFDLEWRICYTEIENILIRSLNETQIKMYVLLKLVAKAILKPICKDITSYVIKNLILWIVERNAREIFTPEHLTSLLMLGLRSLRNKVDIRLFGSYMIPERNLFLGRITEHEKVEIVRVLDDMLAQGPMFLMKFKELNRLKIAIDKTYDNPLVIEMKIKLWHYFSLMFSDERVFNQLSGKVLVGTILAEKYFQLDDFQKEKLKDLIYEIENTNIENNDDIIEDVDQTLHEIVGSQLENEDDLLSTMYDFCTLV